MEPWKTIWDRLPLVLNYAFMLLVLALLSGMFPQTLRFKYQYDVGSAWAYEDLYAPFDFAIPKTVEQYKAELDAAVTGSAIYYRLDDSVQAVQTRRFEEAFELQLDAIEKGQFKEVKKNPLPYRTYGIILLDSLYERGVVLWDKDYSRWPSPPAIEVVSGNTSRKKAPGDLLSEAQALQALKDSLTHCGLSEPEFLFQILSEAIEPNVSYDAALNRKMRDNVVEAVSPYRGMVRKNELIVPRGGMVTAPVYQMLEGYREAYLQGSEQQRSRTLLFLGYFLLTTFVLGAFLLFLRYAHPYAVFQLNHLLFILLWPLAIGGMTYLIRSGNVLSPYMVPFALVPLVLKNFYDNRLALYGHLVVAMLGSLISSQGFAFLFLQLMVGGVVVIARLDTLGWNRFFYVILLVFLTYGVGYFALELIEGAAWENIDWGIFYWLLLNSFLLLLAYPLTSAFERLFGFTSVLRLKELEDTDRPLLLLLSQQAPGTYQHSLQVANLAEAAARSIGADALLARVGALYHDIGKIANPEYFIENQSGENPHRTLSPLESARTIIAHVQDGVALARKYHLPRVVADFIRTHHGTTRVEFFYQQHLKGQSADALAEQQEPSFRYPGPRPISKEATVVMLADSIEAACKSLKDPTGQAIDDMIERLIAHKAEQCQLSDSTLSFSELEACKQTLKQKVRSMYHFRVEYPGQRKTMG